MYSSKTLYVTMYSWVWGKAPGRNWGAFENFCVKSNVTLQSVRLLLTVNYRKNGEAGCIACSPNNFVRGACSPVPPCSRAYAWNCGRNVIDSLQPE